jgi:hypothetical protein
MIIERNHSVPDLLNASGAHHRDAVQYRGSGSGRDPGEAGNILDRDVASSEQAQGL